MNDIDRQLGLDFPLPPPNYARENFIVPKGQRSPITVLENWIAASDAGNILTISGPARAGKSHLAHISAQLLCCDVISAAELSSLILDGARAKSQIDLSQRAIVIDVVDDLADPVFMHEYLAKRAGMTRKTILSGNGEPGQWAQGLPDLATRLESYPRVSLNEPSEELLKAVIKKMFKDRQLDVNPRLLSYASVRIPKTFEAATRFVEACDRLSITRKKKINQKLAQKVVENLSQEVCAP